QQMVKALFESGAASHEIAQRRGIKQSSVVRSLEYLQNAGQIDTCSWVEEQLPPQSLRKGKAYFQDRPQSSLRAAYESLGLDYDSLRMCRMYVSSLKTRID
ncbi:MAG: helix-turn-helix domain-containing protein, partial [Bacteroidota bacterium]